MGKMTLTTMGMVKVLTDMAKRTCGTEALTKELRMIRRDGREQTQQRGALGREALGIAAVPLEVVQPELHRRRRQDRRRHLPMSIRSDMKREAPRNMVMVRSLSQRGLDVRATESIQSGGIRKKK